VLVHYTSNCNGKYLCHNHMTIMRLHPAEA
jgi:hypothetical protein